MSTKKKLTQEEKDRRFYRRAWNAVAGFFRFVMRLSATGKENVPAEGGYILCINHIAAVDVISVAAVCPRQLRFLAKKELFRIPLLGWLIRRLGACPLDRGGSDVAAIKKTVSLASGGELVGIFPQGHRYPGKNPADTPIKNGAGMIAYRSRCSVIPVCLKMKKQKYALFRRVEVIFGNPISNEELFPAGEGNSEAYAAASRRIFDEICRLGGFVPSDKGENA
ncbi:MAG: 1-acyl-sn-glycerol-3-phosphate acyltransferase [Clostridia bacterium]|nr:1-acyl-sn-glycerol-3-phosphate acyltransferase [Clostridia bacterium]MBQ8859643.1 1-acyl-sn-glycerol-3-phosphate acyltransferase [Clostridia bacterium]